MKFFLAEQGHDPSPGRDTHCVGPGRILRHKDDGVRQSADIPDFAQQAGFSLHDGVPQLSNPGGNDRKSR